MIIDISLIIAIKKLIVEAGAIAVNIRKAGIQVNIKDDNSPVTNADKAISQYIFDELTKITPNIPVICEERSILPINKNRQFWLIDPIDGTRSFINNKDSFTVNIALINNKIPVYGFIYQPDKNKLYFTNENQELCIEQNGKLINKNTHNKKSFVAVVSSNHFNLATSNYLEENNLTEIISIPSSLKLCLIAEGAADIFPKFGTTMEWDIAAGHALIRASGGNINLFDGNEMFYAKDDFKNPNFIAANKKWIDSQ